MFEFISVYGKNGTAINPRILAHFMQGPMQYAGFPAAFSIGHREGICPDYYVTANPNRWGRRLKRKGGSLIRRLTTV